MKLRLLWIFSCFMFQEIQCEIKDRLHIQQHVENIERYGRLCVAVAYKIYTFFRREKYAYDFQVDVVNHPFKKLLYDCNEQVEKLFDDANQHDNPLVQIKAIILLCRVAVPVWYVKSFQKGLEILVKDSFDQEGNFVDEGCSCDIRLLFKDYYRRAPITWQQIARISERKCRKRKVGFLYTPYYAFTCTSHNEELLAMIEAARAGNEKYLQYLVDKNNSSVAYKIYKHYQVSLLKETYPS